MQARWICRAAVHHVKLDAVPCAQTVGVGALVRASKRACCLAVSMVLVAAECCWQVLACHPG
jgi:hypothetical protein